MLKIACIGAGNIFFSHQVIQDILEDFKQKKHTKGLPITISLMDWDQTRVKNTYQSIKSYISKNSPDFDNIDLTWTTNMETAINEAKYVITTIINGGYEGYKDDIDTPAKYGVMQTIGDTLGPGGIFRFLRNVPIYRKIIKYMNTVGYNAGIQGIRTLQCNYSNPLSMSTWYCNSLWEESTVGICHGVQTSAILLRKILGVSKENFTYLSAGITHMNWFLKIYYRNSQNETWKNAYPVLKEKISQNLDLIDDDLVRYDLLKATGYFMTETSGGISELVPYYRKNKEILKSYSVTNEKNLKPSLYTHNNLMQIGIDKKKFEEFEESTDNVIQQSQLQYFFDNLHEIGERDYISGLIRAIEFDHPFTFYGNVSNKDGGLITNLPESCIVEVPCMADSFGIHPQGGIKLPTICQGLCNNNIMAQKAAVEAALEFNHEKIYQALLLDPLTSMALTPEKIREMMDEMLDNQKEWISWIDN
jgi:alpha-galactosidase